MSSAGETLRSARREAGLTQQQLAERLNTSQAAIAKLERAGSNPTIATLERVLHAAGHGLTLRAERLPDPSVDDTLVAGRLRLTPAQRLAAFEATYVDIRELARAGARARGELA